MHMLLPGGIYPPLPTFFDDQEELDLVTLQRHIRRLYDSGVAGYGGRSRRPLLPLSLAERDRLAAKLDAVTLQ